MSSTRRSVQPDSGTSPEPVPRSGDVLQVTRAASVQFTNPIHFRVIRVHDWPTYTGWVWLDGYELNDLGEAVERRSIFVQAAGLRQVPGLKGPRGPRASRVPRRVTEVPASPPQ